MATNCLPWRPKRQRLLWWQLLVACGTTTLLTWLLTPTPTPLPCPHHISTPTPIPSSHHTKAWRHWHAAILHIIQRWPTTWVLQSLQINDHTIHLRCTSQHTSLHQAWRTLQPLLHHASMENIHHQKQGYQAELHYATTMPAL